MAEYEKQEPTEKKQPNYELILTAVALVFAAIIFIYNFCFSVSGKTTLSFERKASAGASYDTVEAMVQANEEELFEEASSGTETLPDTESQPPGDSSAVQNVSSKTSSKETPSTASSKNQTSAASSKSQVSTVPHVAENAAHDIVYVTPTGKKYHYLSTCGGKNSTEIPFAEAEEKGYTPCAKCAN